MNEITNAKNCVLAGICTLADGPKCTRLCAPYIGMHGADGRGGRHGIADLPQEYRLVTLDNAAPAKDQAEAYEVIRGYVTTFKRQFEDGGERLKSLYLVSISPGTGKTTTAAAILNEWLRISFVGALRRNRQAPDLLAYFLDVNAWQTDYNAFNRARVPDSIAGPAAERYYRAFSAAQSAPFAVLDDIGVRDVTDGFRGDLHAVINARVTNALPTVYTSNVEIDALARVFNDRRLPDRIRDQCAVIKFEGGSKRGVR